MSESQVEGSGDGAPIVTSSSGEPPVGDNGGTSVTDPHSLNELTNLIQSLLQQTQDRFQTMSDQIIKRIDDMGKRIDDLETNLNDLMTQVGVDDQQNATPPTQ